MKAESLNLDAFIQRFHEADRLNKKKRFCWILGAGASVTSGIPAGKTFAKRWFEEIHLAEKAEDESETDFIKRLPDLAKAHEVNLSGFSIDKAGDNYSELYDYRFRDDPDAGFAQIEDAMRGKDPGLGYSILAKILAETRHRIVITVNFDNLVGDAIAIHTDVFPLVCGHESLARYIELEAARPLVFKLHRDLLLGPMSRASEMEKLQREWLPVLKNLMAEYTPIVIGYDGNDRTLMSFLRNLDSLNGNLYWCHRIDSKPRQEIHDLVRHHRGRLVAINGFDELMFSIGAPLNCVDPVTTLKCHYDRRAKIYTEQLATLQDKIKQVTPIKNIPAPALSELQKAVAQAINQAERSPEWWSWELKARNTKSTEERDSCYIKGIEACPKSSELAANYAIFLKNIKKDYPKAEEMYLKAIELNPNDSNNFSNYAVFLNKIRGDSDKAEEMYRKSIELNPNNATAISNYAVFLDSSRKDFDKAEAMYRKSMEIEPNNAIPARNYASFLSGDSKWKDYDKADAMYRKSMELNSNDAKTVCAYAAFLFLRRQNNKDSEKFLKKALELDPKHATSNGNYAFLLWQVHKNYNLAEQFYKKYLEYGGDDAFYYRKYAEFLRTVRKNEKEAQLLEKRADELGDNNTQ